MTARILCVDDERDIRRLLDAILTMSGYRTLAAGTASRGLSLVRLRPDLVILDINLPDVDGIEMCRRLRRIDERVPVVFLTAATGARRAEALAAGGDAFVEKPFDVDDLLVLIERLLARSPERRIGRDRRVRADPPPAGDCRAGERRAPVPCAAVDGQASTAPAPRASAVDGRARRVTAAAAGSARRASRRS